MNKARQSFLLLGDLAVLGLALALTIFIRYRLISQDSRPFAEILHMHQGPFAVVFVLWLLCFYISGLYRPTTLSNGRSFNRSTFSAIAIAAILSVIYFYLQSGSDITPKTTLFIFIVVFSIIFLPWRFLCNLALKSYLPKNKVMFIGADAKAEKLGQELVLYPQLGWKYEGVLDLERIEELSQIIKEKGIRTLILNSRVSSERAQQVLFDCLKLKVNFYNFPHFYDYHPSLSQVL